VLLGFLYRKPDHGYELHKQMEVEFENIWHASQSQTYSILKRLESQGFISSKQVEQEKLPSKQLLFITDKGKERFEEWLVKPTKASVHAIRVEFISRLYFTQCYYPQNIQPMITAQLQVVTNGLNQQEENVRNLPEEQTFKRLALELRIKLLSSMISWLNECYATARRGQAFGPNHESSS
jgi:PadR family transcriptional regulator, regulatory protein AphA